MSQASVSHETSRKKRMVACGPCRERKVKCSFAHMTRFLATALTLHLGSGNLPCEQCKRHGEQCHYPERQAKRRHQRRDQATSLVQRLESLEERLLHVARGQRALDDSPVAPADVPLSDINNPLEPRERPSSTWRPGPSYGRSHSQSTATYGDHPPNLWDKSDSISTPATFPALTLTSQGEVPLSDIYAHSSGTGSQLRDDTAVELTGLRTSPIANNASHASALNPVTKESLSITSLSDHVSLLSQLPSSCT